MSPEWLEILTPWLAYFRPFVWGLAGGACMEFVLIHRQMSRLGRLAPRYGKKLYWFTAFGAAVAGGLMALAHHIENDWVALQIGVTAPLILDRINAEAGQPSDDE